MPFGLDLKSVLVTAAFLLFIFPMLQAFLSSRKRSKVTPA